MSIEKLSRVLPHPDGPITDIKTLRSKNDFVHNFGLGNIYPTDPAKIDVQNGMSSHDTSEKISFNRQSDITKKAENT